MPKACPRKFSPWIPCVVTDGDICYAESERGLICVGCEATKATIEADPTAGKPTVVPADPPSAESGPVRQAEGESG